VPELPVAASRVSRSPTRESATRPVAGLLWIAALVLMLGAAVWQRLTGPTHPRRGTAVVAGQTVRWRLLRSSLSGEPFMVALAAPPGVTGVVRFRRYPTNESLRDVPMSREGEDLVALLPSQPPAGKLEYSVVLSGPSGPPVLVPEGEPIVMRFKGDVPALLLVPHVVTMFVAMMIGIRAALAAAVGRPEARRYAWVTVVGIAIGGLVLGPIVQKHAFGAFWTGWPFGSDLTDDKTLAMWLAWVAAVAVFRHRKDPLDRVARWVTVAAALVMIAVYVVPHSLRGSELDYSKVEAPRAGEGAR
jgi:hypothetical protein